MCRDGTTDAGVEVGSCTWPGTPLDRAYHDAEWGVALRDEVRLFELLTLEGAQAGLSWSTILRKREGYRRAFAGFDPARVAAFDAADVERLLQDEGIVRHRGKIESCIGNARALLALQTSGDSLTALVWRHVNGTPIVNRWTTHTALPAQTPVSAALSRDLQQHGFRFVGPTTCYAFMQAAGLVNDHLVTCARWRAVQELGG